MKDTPNEHPEASHTARMRACLAAALADADAPDLLAAPLRRLQDADQITARQMADRLQTEEAGLHRLSLCRAPREAHFAEDVARLATHCNCDPSALLSLLRRVQVLTAFADSNAPAASAASAAAPAASALPRGAVLLAARDKEHDESNPDEESEGDDD